MPSKLEQAFHFEEKLPIKPKQLKENRRPQMSHKFAKVAQAYKGMGKPKKFRPRYKHFNESKPKK